VDEVQSGGIGSMSAASGRRHSFHVVSPFTLEECLERLGSEDGEMLRVVSAGSQIRAAIETRKLGQNTVVFCFSEAFYNSPLVLGKFRHWYQTGLSLEGKLIRRQDDGTDIYGSTKTSPVWFFGAYTGHLIASIIVAAMFGIALSNYSALLSILTATVILVGLLAYSIRRINKHRTYLRDTLTSLLHASKIAVHEPPRHLPA
jgi:hypothetical protein